MRSAKSPNSNSRKDSVYHARSSFLKHSAHAAADKRGESVTLNGSTSSAYKAPSVQPIQGTISSEAQAKPPQVVSTSKTQTSAISKPQQNATKSVHKVVVLDADNNPSQVLRDDFLDTTGEPEDDNVKFTTSGEENTYVLGRKIRLPKRLMVWVSSAS